MNIIEEVPVAGNKLSRRQFLAFLLQCVVVASLPSCRKSVPFFDGSKALAPFVAEDHSQFLSRWAEQGIRDAVLINFDTHDDIVRIPDQKIAQLKGLYQQQYWRRFSEADEHTATNRGLFGVANWIYAGGKLGVFSEVYWVIPFQLFGRKDAEAGLRQVLTDVSFDKKDIATFALKDGVFKGTVNGIPFSLCSVEALPTVDKPVLLSIDVDFFPTFSTATETSYLSALYRVFTELCSKKYNVQESAVCYSINGEYLQPHLRWVGDAAVQMFSNPLMFKNNAPSELLNLQQYLENAFRSKDSEEILKLSRLYLNSHPEASVFIYQAFAYVLKGDADNAYRAAMAGCQLDKLYCASLTSIGTGLYVQGQYRVAERFYRGGLAVDPKMKVGLFQFGNCLQKTGKWQEALDVYEKDVVANGPFPTEFMMADVFIKRGDRINAERTLRRAVQHLGDYSKPLVLSRALADAIYVILDFCKSNALNDIFAALHNHRMTQKMYRDFQRE
jgi:tetratricopeptide (TPR) repeat protein